MEPVEVADEGEPAAAEATAPQKRASILPVPTIDYAPETGLALGGVALATLHPFPDARPATVDLELAVTARRQVILDTTWRVYLPEDRWLLAGSAAGKRYPDRFWGVGPEAPERAAEDYDAWELELSPEALYRPGGALFVGPAWSFSGMYAVEPEPGGRLAAAQAGEDNGEIVGASGGVASGPGLGVVWDSRDNPQNPGAGGRYLAFHQYAFLPVLGGDFAFGRSSLDARAFLGTRGGQVLAVQAVVEARTGAPPFQLLAMAGGDTITRGYWHGRWRDRDFLAAQAEYRAPLWWRLGGVAFVGVGEVTPSLSEHHLDWLLPTVGGGLRVMVLPEEGLNLRLDYALGLGAGAVEGSRSSGFYFGFGEVF